MDLVCSFRYGSFDRLLVIVGQNRRHRGNIYNREWISECPSERCGFVEVSIPMHRRYPEDEWWMVGRQHIKEHTQFG